VCVEAAAGNTVAQKNPAFIDTLFQELTITPGDSLDISCIGGTRRGRILRELDLSGGVDLESLYQPGGLYWVVGGNGSLGGIVAEHIARQTHGTVVLSGRSEPGDRIATVLAKLESMGARAAYLPVDLSDPEDTKQTVREIRSRFGPLKGIVHCAGVLRDALLTKKTLKQAEMVLVPKVDGVVNIDDATRDEPLDFLLLFSSLAAIMGNPGQVDYAYANAFLDHFAADRETLRLNGRRKGRTISVNWPYWVDGGMKVSGDVKYWMEQDFGLRALPSGQGLRLLEELWRLNRPQVAVFHGVSSMIRNRLAKIEGLPSDQDRPSELKAKRHENFVTKEQTIAFLCDVIAEKLRIPPKKLDPLQEFANYGIDSISVMAITRELELVFGRLRKTLFFEYRTVEALAEYFLTRHSEELARHLPPATASGCTACAADHSHLADQPAVTTEYTDRVNLTPAANEGVAIIGLSGRYAMADNLEVFWENLRTGRDCITEIPHDRWDGNAFYDPDRTAKGKSYSKWGGFLANIDKFDPLFFNISPREAELMDPQERLFLETAWHAMEDSGYRREDLEGRCVGVYVGVMHSEYTLLKPSQTGKASSVPPAVTHASIANRVSYFLNLRGPSCAIDTLCSSSLTAVHLACESIRQKECELAIAGGVNLSLHPNKYLQLSQGQFISSDGRCRSFGAGGDGYVPSEGVGAVLLKPIGRAIADRDRIYGVIVSSAVNHSGRTNGFFVPDPHGQEELIAAALKKANVSPRTIGYLEAHGTGTVLGDPIEVEGLTRAFAAYTSDKQFCAIGSVKSNIGHAEAAAGIAGLTKVLLQMQYRQLVPSLHCNPPNPHIEFEQSPFYVQRELTTWMPLDEARCLRAGISSFGAGGTNAHLIVESFEIVSEKGASHFGPNIVVLSAKTEECLKAYALSLLNFIQRDWIGLGTQPAFEAICYTLQTGREAMTNRLAIVASGVEELCKRLNAWLKDESTEGGFVITGKSGADAAQLVRGAAGDHFVAAVLAERDMPRLAQLWVMGVVIDWRQLYQSGIPQKVSLPGYPFARESHWFGDSDVSPATSSDLDRFIAIEPVVSLKKQTSLSVRSVDDYQEESNGDGRLLQLLQQLKEGKLDIEAVENSITGGPK
jgi:polyketide synthase PksN